MGKVTKWKRGALVACLAATTCLMACGSDGDDGEANDNGGDNAGDNAGNGTGGTGANGSNGVDEVDETPAKDYKFLFVPKALSNPVFRPAIDGAQLRAQELSETSNDKVTVEVIAPEASDPDMQATLINAAVAAGGVSGIAVSCAASTNEALIGALSSAQAQGIPVLAWDSDCGARDAFYSLDNEASGKLAAQLLAKQIGDKGNVAVLTGSLTDDNIVKRVAGFTNEIAANHPNITVVQTVSCDPAKDDHLCPPKLDQAMTDHKVDGWFFAAVWMRILARGDGSMRPELNGNKIPATALWQKGAMDGTVKTVALDSLTEALPFVEDGRIQVLIGQKYWGWGYDTIGLLHNHLDKGVAMTPFLDSGTDLICEANVDQYSAAWASNDFSVKLPSCK